MKQIRVLVADPGQPPEPHTLEYGMIPMRALLGAELDLVLIQDHCAIFQGKDARARRLPMNRTIAGRHRTFGRILITRLSDESAADIGSLTDREIEHWTQALK